MKGFKNTASAARSGFDSYLTEVLKSPKFRISQLHKKNYPLNLTLTWTSENKEKEQKKTKKKFGFFCGEKRMDKGKGEITKCVRFGALEDDFDTAFRDLHQSVSVDVPEISYNDFKEKISENCIVKEVYQPITVRFSQRSKMTVYSKSPIFCLPKGEKKFSLGDGEIKSRVYRIRNAYRFELGKEPRGLEMKLERLENIIKDPLIYDN